MSRRSLLSPDTALIRSQRRGVPNTRMWSEQPTPPQVVWDGHEEDPGPPPMVLAVNRIALGGGLGGPAPGGFRRVTLEEGDSACVVMWGRIVWDLTAPDGWTVEERFSLFSGVDTEPYLVASIIGAPAGDHDFTYVSDPRNIHSAALVGYRLTGSAGGSWSFIHGEEIIPTDGAGRIMFQTPDPRWAVAWQEAVACGVFTGLNETAPPGMSIGEGNGGVSVGYCWPRGTDPALFAPDGNFQQPGIYYTYTTIGAYGPPACVAFAFGWTA